MQRPTKARESAHTAQRTCVACRAVVDRAELVRLIEGPDGQIAVDAKGSNGGRGAWVHPSRACIATAAKRHAAERSLKVNVRAVDADALVAQARDGFARRATGLLSNAFRARSIAAGSDVVEQAVNEGRAALLVVARDAGDTTRSRAETLAATKGVSLRAFGSRAELGALFGRGEVAIAAVLEPRVGAELVVTIDRFAGLEG
ncbi:MAG: DUF448 domain-containing protein [Polyangiales bacterium]